MGRSGARISARLGAAVGVAIAAAAIVTALSFTRAVELIDRPLQDAALRLASASPPELAREIPDVAIVEIDPRSLRAFPEWPWPRDRYGLVTERLFAVGARAVAFDIDLSTPREESSDAVFAAAIRAHREVVLAALRQRQQMDGAGELEIVSWPAARFLEAGARAGHVVVPIDSDGVVRHAQGEAALGGDGVASLPAALLERLGIPLAREMQGLHRIDFRRTAPAIPALSITDVIEDRFDPSLIAGRAVLIGATAAEFQDLWTTPAGPARPGVWVQAIEYRTLAAAAQEAATLRAAPRSLLFALCLLLALAAKGSDELPSRRRVAWFAALSAGALAACWGSLLWLGVLLSPSLPLVQLAGHYVAGLERVRRTLGLRLRSRELSLAALHDLGESTSSAGDETGLEASLVLLGRIIDAHAVALLRATAAGALDGSRVDWRPHGELAAVDLEAAQQALATRRLRLFSEIPARSGVRGLALYAPLVAGRLPVGVLVIESRSTAALGDTELRTVATVCSQLALTVRSLRLAEDLRATLDASVEAIASAVEARDGYTELHCRRLALFCVSMARRLGLPQEEIEAIRLGALLHDVGKIGVRDHVLLKPGRFTPDERREMERHAEIGHRIVHPITGLMPTTLACVRGHHERWDGMGYPDALRGDQIPLGARIVAIVDVWDALSSERPYKPAYAQSKVRETLRKDRGTHFDPALVDLFFQVLDEEGEEMLALVQASRPSES